MSFFFHANTTLLLAPLSLVRGGYYNYSSGNLDDQSTNGRYWLQRLDNATYGNYLYFHSDLIYLQYYVSRGRGFSLRCLALDSAPILAPLSLVRGGYYQHNAGSLVYQDSSGVHWLYDNIPNPANARSIGFRSANIANGASDPRGFGFSLRCLTRYLTTFFVTSNFSIYFPNINLVCE